MEVFLSKQCESLAGSLGQGFGYHIQRRIDHDGKIHFWAVRQSKGIVPPSGHLRFILTCATLAKSKLHIADIRVSAKEFREACWQADRWYGRELIIAKDSHVFNADDVLSFKKRWSL